MLRRRRRGWRSGVMLAELMVVTGVMGDLVGNSGNAFLNVMDKARADACLQNLKQLYLAIQMVTDDNDGRLPLAWFFPDARYPQDPYNLVNVVAGSDGSIRKLFVCPSAPEAWQKTGNTYVYNDQWRGWLKDSIPDPANTWLLMDCNVMDPRFPAPHLNGYNVLFMDGHAKWIPAAQIAQVWQHPATVQSTGGGGPSGTVQQSGGAAGGGDMDDIY